MPSSSIVKYKVKVERKQRGGFQDLGGGVNGELLLKGYRAPVLRRRVLEIDGMVTVLVTELCP